MLRAAPRGFCFRQPIEEGDAHPVRSDHYLRSVRRSRKPSDRPIFKSDIEKPTPYNTYIINGLPPTPIANPGKAALEAVANPLDTEDLYFVADGTGGHVFAKTLQEHNANVRKWRSVEQKNVEQQKNSSNASAGQ